MVVHGGGKGGHDQVRLCRMKRMRGREERDGGRGGGRAGRLWRRFAVLGVEEWGGIVAYNSRRRGLVGKWVKRGGGEAGGCRLVKVMVWVWCWGWGCMVGGVDGEVA